jgi:hypothetical protein
MRSFLRAFPLLALAALGVAGCDDETTPPTTPTPPAATVTESFSGSLSKNGGVTFSFTVGATGQVTATLATLTAADGTKVGLSLGNWNGTTCQVVLANDNAIQGTFVTGTMSSAGSLCVRLYDAAGTVEGTASFRVDVVHP